MRQPWEPPCSLMVAWSMRRCTAHKTHARMRPANSSCVSLSEAELGADEGRITRIHLLASLASSFNCGHQFTRHCRGRLPTLCNSVDVLQDGFNSGGPSRQGLLNRLARRRGDLCHAAMVALPGLTLCALPRIRIGRPAADPPSANAANQRAVAAGRQ